MKRLKMSKKVLLLFLLIFIISSFFVGCKKEVLLDIPQEDMLSLTDNSFKRDNDTIRIMSANVLVDIKSWGGEPVYNRANRLSLAVKEYMPDVIAAQEFSKNWYKKFMPKVEDIGYKVIKEKYTLFIENRSPIIYNTNTVNLIEHGIFKFSEGDNNGCRVISWAVFDRKSDNKRFAVTSTHFNLIRTAKLEESISIMNTQVKELKEQIENLSARINAPIFIAGDFNSMEEREEYFEYELYGAVSKEEAAFDIYKQLAQTYVDAKYENNVDKHDVGGGILPNGAWSSPTWDHIFYKGECEIKTFGILSGLFFQQNEDNTEKVSDHLLIFADAII